MKHRGESSFQATLFALYTKNFFGRVESRLVLKNFKKVFYD